MPIFHDTYVGVGVESTYGTQAPPTSFHEFLSEDLVGKYERIESEGLRSGATVLRTDRWAVNPKGAEGGLKLEALDVGLNPWLRAAFGGESTVAPVGGFTTSTYTLGDLRGRSLSTKIGRVDTAGNIQHFDYLGCKVKMFEISCAVDGIAQLSFDLDAAKEVLGATAGVPVSPAFSTQLLTFVKSEVLINGAQLAVMDASVKLDNKLNTSRYAARGAASTTKREPLNEGFRELSFELKAEFENMGQYSRVASASEAGATASLSATWESPQGGQIVITAPFARFDEFPVNVDGAKIIESSLSGVLLSDQVSQPITLTYKAKSS